MTNHYRSLYDSAGIDYNATDKLWDEKVIRSLFALIKHKLKSSGILYVRGIMLNFPVNTFRRFHLNEIFSASR